MYIYINVCTCIHTYIYTCICMKTATYVIAVGTALLRWEWVVESECMRERESE